MARGLVFQGSPGYQGSKETLTWDFNAASSLAVGDVVTSPSITFESSYGGGAWTSASTSLSGGATVSGSTISQTITSLSAGYDYRITIVFNAGGTKRIEGYGYIKCEV